MIIDTHCHIDMYMDPLEIIKESETKGIITIAMTNLPSHFEMGFPFVRQTKKVRLALGMHPLYAEHHLKEFNGFQKHLSKTSYIGEIGLDFSREGFSTKEIQIESFRRILKEIRGKKKIISIHSRRAEDEILKMLIENNTQNAIFHWYSGPLGLIDKIVENGYYFSINQSMILSKSGQQIINRIPLSNLLTESDGPFIKYNNRENRPSDIALVIEYLSKKNNLSSILIEEQISQNFKKLLNGIV